MKRKTIYKLMSLCLTLLIALCAFMPAKALNGAETADITISGIDANYGATVTAYKLINVNLDDAGNQEAPAYAWDSNVAGWLREEGFETFLASGTNDVSDAFQKLTDNEDVFIDFVNKIARVIQSGSLTVDESKPKYVPADPNAGSIETKDVEYKLSSGAYLFIITDGVKIYTPGFAKVYPVYNNDRWSVAGDDININAKSNEPSIAKSMNNDELTLAIEEEVTYTLTVEVPQYSDNVAENKKAFKIYDILPSGLDFNDDVIIEAQVEDEKKDITDCFVESTETGKTFVYTAKYADLKKALKGQTTIQLTYSAIVNKDAYTADTLRNTAAIEYDIEPYNPDSSTNTVTDFTQSYTYGIQVTKEVDTPADNVLINGTTFTLSQENNVLNFLYDNDGGYYYPAKDVTLNSSNTLTVQNGKILIHGLDVGTYILKETKAPDGYAVPSEATTIVLTDTAENLGELDAVNVSGPNVKEDYAVIDTTYKNQLDLTIMNYKNEFNLPTTGGMGTMIFTVGGILLMGGAVILMVFVLRKKKEQ